MTVLEILARRGSVGVSDVAGELAVHKSTAFRLLSALERRGLVEQDGDRGKYRLGFGVLRLASAVIGRLDLVRQARPVLEDLAATVGETVNLAVLRSHYAVNVDEARGSAAVAAQNWTGQLTPLHATSSGKVLLAFQSAAERNRLLASAGLARFTKRTITSAKVLGGELDRTRAAGFATAFEEYEEGLNAVAGAVRDHTNSVVASLSVSGPGYRLDEERVAHLARIVVAAAGRISQRLGQLN